MDNHVTTEAHDEMTTTEIEIQAAANEPQAEVEQHPVALPEPSATPQDSAPIVPLHEAPLAEIPAAPLAVEAPLPIVAETPQDSATAAEPVVQAEAPKPVKPPVDPAVLAARDAARKAAEAKWARLAGAKDSGETVHGKVKSEIKGGLLLDVEGYRAFLPASQTRVKKGEPLGTLVNAEVPLKVLDVDDKRKRLVVSHRRAVEQERRASRAALLAELKIGLERPATVVRLADFGAFVDLGGIDALVPIGELAFERLEKPSDAVNVGDSFTVKILRIDEGGKKIAASRKASLADPWRDHADILKTGNVVEGKVIAKEPRLTIEIAPGVSGTISDREADPNEYEIGESVEVTVRGVDYRNRRIRLGTMHSAQTFSSTSFAPLGKELGN
jgi:small subunit ribosomal protein S1